VEITFKEHDMESLISSILLVVAYITFQSKYKFLMGEVMIHNSSSSIEAFLAFLHTAYFEQVLQNEEFSLLGCDVV
jgi:hypothetical protein